MPMKSCPSCKGGCGPRTRVCKCGYTFAIGVKEAAPEVEEKELPEAEEAAPVLYHKPMIYALAGKAPKWTGDLEQWLDDVYCDYPGYDITPSAMLNLLRWVVKVDEELKTKVRESMFSRIS